MKTLPVIAAFTLLTACNSHDSRLKTHDSAAGGGDWQLTLQHTIQPAEGVPGNLINPGWMSLRADGALLVTDGPPVAVKLFGADGKFVRTIGHKGDGPGEYQSAYPLWLGDTVLVQDARGAGKGLTYLTDGTFLKSFPAVCCVGGTGPALDQNNRIRLLGAGPPDSLDPARFVLQWVWLDAAGNRLDSMIVPVAGTPKTWNAAAGGGGVAHYTVPFSPASVAEPLRDGRILLGFGSKYQIAIIGRTGDTTAVFGRSDVVAPTIPDSLRTAAFEQIVRPPITKTDASIDDIPTHYPFFNQFFEDGAGNIWVRRPTTPGSPTLLDIFSSDGELQGTVAMPTTNGFARLAFAGDLIAIEDTDQNDLPRIRVYRAASTSPSS